MPDDDVRAIRALAHPLRLTLLDLLRFDGPATATLLARRLDESSGATSYHLRQLARHGYIEEVRQEGRERWWRYRDRPVIAPAGKRSGSRNLVAELLSREAHALDGYLAEDRRRPDWDEAAFFQSRALRLTAAELDQLRRQIESLLGRLRPADASEAPASARPVSILTIGFPVSVGTP